MAKQVESPKKGKRYLTPKDKQFIENYVKNGGNATQAVWDMNTCETRAAASTTGVYYRNKLKEEIDKRLEKYGLTEELVMTRHRDIIKKGKDPVAMDGIKTYYKLIDRDMDDDDREITVHLKF